MLVSSTTFCVDPLASTHGNVPLPLVITATGIQSRVQRRKGVAIEHTNRNRWSVMTTSDSSSAGAVERDLLADTVTNASVPIFLKDQEGNYLYVNDAFLSQASSSKEDIIGRSDADLYPEVIAEIYQRDDQTALVSAAPVHTVRPFIVNDEHRIFHTAKFPIKAADGHVVGVCGITVDITDTLLEEAREAEHRRHISDETFKRLFATLTPREARVADLLVLGYADKEIAETLDLSPDTVRHHVSHVLRKLRKQSRTQAVIEMLKHRG